MQAPISIVIVGQEKWKMGEAFHAYNICGTGRKLLTDAEMHVSINARP